LHNKFNGLKLGGKADCVEVWSEIKNVSNYVYDKEMSTSFEIVESNNIDNMETEHNIYE